MFPKHLTCRLSYKLSRGLSRERPLVSSLGYWSITVQTGVIKNVYEKSEIRRSNVRFIQVDTSNFICKGCFLCAVSSMSGAHILNINIEVSHVHLIAGSQNRDI